MASHNSRQRQGTARSGLNAILREVAGLTLWPVWSQLNANRRGTILRMERVRPNLRADFTPNSHCETTPEFLESLIEYALESDIEIVSLSEARKRIVSKRPQAKFLSLTFDGAYKDHFDYVLPLLRRYELPFTLFTATYWSEGEGLLWSLALEEIIRKQAAIVLNLEHETAYVESATTRQKYRAFMIFENHIRSLDPVARQSFCCELAQLYDVDLKALCQETMMNWNELRRVNASRQATIGSYGLNYHELNQSTPQILEAEIRDSLTIFEAQLGQRPEFYAYQDIGRQKISNEIATIAKDQGLSCALTRQHGTCRHNVNAKQQNLDLRRLPRVSPAGKIQRQRYRNMLISGAFSAIF